MVHLCEFCGKSFTRKNNLLRHSERLHGGIQFKYNCTICKRNFSKRESYNSHMSAHFENKHWSLLGPVLMT